MVPSPDILTRFSACILRHKLDSRTHVIYPGYISRTDLDILTAKSFPGDQLSVSDFIALRELKDDLTRLCTRAQERGVRVMIDAEYRSAIKH